MKKTKAFISLILSFALVFSTFTILRISAATDNTRYSIKHLQNGNFEENQDNYKFSANYTQPFKSAVPYWDTTAYGSTGNNGQFEFFKSGSAHFNVTKKYYPNKAEYLKVAEGNVAAELNADEESTIYQRIHTVSGSTYTWGLDHRGRDLTDRMVLIIGPEQDVDPSKTSKKGKDQFVRITDWLRNQYNVEYPDKGCSKKYTVYSKAFAASGTFVDDAGISNEDNNISLVETDVINQEWNIWVISSPYCNTSTDTTKAVKGWSKYGTNVIDSDNNGIDKEEFYDIMKGESSSLGYDCTYTVPKGQTNTIFAFCSYSSGMEGGVEQKTYGNLLDDINFDIYQPISTSITPGGIGGATSENVVITSNITTGNAMSSIVEDGQYCTIHTKAHNDILTDCKFTGAYVTVNADDGTPETTFYEIYTGDISNLTDEEIFELSKTYFISKTYTDSTGETWDYYFNVPVNSPVYIHLIYTKAPYVLYDVNGGAPYYLDPDNTAGKGGNLVGFGDAFQEVEGVDTSEYYTNSQYTGGASPDEPQVVEEGKYISHAALPNESWEENSAKFCGWSVKDSGGNQVILDGEHTITYNPTNGNGGIVSITDSSGTIQNLELDATHGITLTAVWKFVNRAQAQTLNSSGVYENSAVGGTVAETFIPDDLRSSDVAEYKQTVWDEERVERVDAAGSVGDKIMFKATPDYANNYAFVGWYCLNSAGEYELRTTSTSIVVSIEVGKFNTYYARFRTRTVPVIFHYTSTGSSKDYDYYDKSDGYQYGKYFQNVVFREKAEKPSGDSKSINTWFTSPTERGAEYIFNFNYGITEETHLYAGPAFAFNYFNYFKLHEPWTISTYGTLKFNGKYIDLKNDADVTNFNVYILKGTLNESTPLASEIKKNSSTIRVGKSVNDTNLIYNTVTNTNQTFNRAGTFYNDFYLFNMKTPVWVVFDFTYKGVTYTSTIKNRSLYNCITTYMNEATNGFYTSYPPETQADLRDAQTDLLNSIKGMYDAVSAFGITESTKYADDSSVSGLTYDSGTVGQYTFESSTAIRNIEPWGFKYSFTVNDHAFTEFSDYGAVVLTDKDGIFNADSVSTDGMAENEKSISINDILKNEKSVMYSKSNNNLYSGENGAVDIYYVNNMSAMDFDKNTYVVFFVKDSSGNCYYSDIITNSYIQIASQDESEYKSVSASIIDYSEKWSYYWSLIEQANNNNN